MWLDEPPSELLHLTSDTTTVPGSRTARVAHESVAIELYWFVHERPLHGLIGATWTDGGSTIEVAVVDWAVRSQVFESLAPDFMNPRTGTSAATARSAVSAIASAAAGRLPSGILVVDRAVESSGTAPVLLDIVSRVVVATMLHGEPECEWLTDTTLNYATTVFREDLASRRLRPDR